MGTFAISASPETIARGNHLIEIYRQNGDKSKEEILNRIFDLAESESVRGTHPELEEPLKAVDKTIAALIKQINGIVAAQDVELEESREKLNKAIEEKHNALEKAKTYMEAADEKEKLAAEKIKKTETDIQIAETKAKEEIDKAYYERDQAIRERDDARTIADEKAASNDLLMKQMMTMEESVAAYKELQEEHAALQESYYALQETAKEEARIAAEALKDATRENTFLTDENEKTKMSLEGYREENKTLSEKNSELHVQINDIKQMSIKAAGDANLAIERAVMAKEREMQKEIRAADKENARLQAIIEQLESQLSKT